MAIIKKEQREYYILSLYYLCRKLIWLCCNCFFASAFLDSQKHGEGEKMEFVGDLVHIDEYNE
jgi:hypothetical protein